jgi:predicted phosphodiesterase
MSSDERRLAVISDIHGNLHALQAVLDAIDGMEIRTIVCCGDVVGYGAFPNECVELLRFRRIPTLVGNHDHAALGLTDVHAFNDIARQAVEWTRLRLNEHFFFAHASPVSPEQWGYVITFGAARACFESFPHRICFIGHSHQPAVVDLNGASMDCPDGAEIPIRDNHRYLVNVGSVGQPRDRNPLSCYVTVDLDEAMIRYHRTRYDIDAAQAAILQQGLPVELAERLSYGW